LDISRKYKYNRLSQT